MMYVRGIRGATTTENNDAAEIAEATSELIQEIVHRNDLDAEQIASVFITTTSDLNAAFPAPAIRAIKGWDFVPLMCSSEIAVPGSLKHCIRILIHYNTTKKQDEIDHVYLRGAVVLRPDLVRQATS